MPTVRPVRSLTHTRAAVETRDAIKSGRYRGFPGLVAEGRVFEMFDLLGLDTIRSYEGAPVDGVLVLRCPTDISRLCPSLSDGAAQRWLWAAGIASDSSIVDFLTLDVKRVGLIGSALKDRDFSYSAMLCLRSKTPAELYIVYFEGIEDYFALIPRVVVTRCSDVAGGILPLMTGFPAFYVPFMVHVTRLAAAVELLTMSILNPDTAVYTNPETGTHMHGLRLAVSQMPPICPVTSERDLELRNRSFAAIKSFWQTLKHVSDVKVSFNAYAPLIADFLLTFELTGLEIRIEHKCFCGPAPGPDYNSSSESLTTLTTRFFRNPFAFARQWHFLVIQIPGARPDDDVFLCIARNEVPDEWASLESLKVRHAVYQQTKRRYFGTNDGVRAMLDWMRLAGPKAIHHAQQLLNAPVEQAYDYGAIDDLSSEEDEPSIADGSSEPADNFDGPHRQWRAPAQRRQYTETLTFWSAQFNDFCCERGSLVCLPLDPGHPWQVNHVVVDHRWTQAEQYDYAVSRQLPLALYQHAVADNKAVALRIADISTSDVPYPVYLRGSQWMKAFPDSPKYFLVGGNLDPKTLEAAIIPPSYVFFPMGFTKQFDPRNAREPPLITSGPHYFRKELQEFGRIPEPKFTDVRAGTKRLSKNDAFMSQPDVNPARYMLDLPEIHKFVGQCLHGTETGLISVNTQQDCRKNQTFDYTEYMRTVRDFNQATWTFGLLRKLHEASNEQAQAADKDQVQAATKRAETKKETRASVQGELTGMRVTKRGNATPKDHGAPEAGVGDEPGSSSMGDALEARERDKRNPTISIQSWLGKNSLTASRRHKP